MRRILAKPHLIIVTALMTIVLGGYAYTRIPADLLPQFDTPAVQIVCFYPGMPPEVMEKEERLLVFVVLTMFRIMLEYESELPSPISQI